MEELAYVLSVSSPTADGLHLGPYRWSLSAFWILPVFYQLQEEVCINA